MSKTNKQIKVGDSDGGPNRCVTIIGTEEYFSP